MKRIFLYTIITLFVLCCKAEKIDINVKSKSMNKVVSGYVITPDSYKSNTDKLYPCVYLLHGYGGSKNSWLYVKKNLQQISSKYNFVFVLPDVGNSWYIDSPVNKNSKYETFVAKELVEYINANFRVIKDRKGRGITGISMGGHGAISLAFKYPDTYGACASTSGALNILDLKDTKFFQNVINKNDVEEFKKNSALYLADKLEAGKLRIHIDCGSEDFLFKQNQTIHNKLLERKIPHNYFVFPGAHTVPYWINSIDYIMIFFDKFFAEKKK